jgi:2-polyprenyl-3-methyl-5-hydroxy-6-metoxy-1,4-benzoquinol methylase
MKSMTTILKHRDANVYIEELPNGKNKIHVELINDDLFMPIKACETRYPIDLIGKILDLKGPNYLCDEILRDESPGYVQRTLKNDLLSYRDEEEFKNKRLLDFGCGAGSSTMILARMFPHTQIVGIELEEKLLSIARLRVTHYGYNNIELMISPAPNSLPPNIGYFDYVLLSGVYEHLLPNERETLLPQIWSVLKPGGILFLNRTPYRYFPVEEHTTSGLLFINYLPDKLALSYAQRFSRRKLKNKSWEELLRGGIRGGSEEEVLSILNHCPQKPILLNPSRFGMKDRIDLWYIQTQCGKARYAAIKILFLLSAKLVKLLTGLTVVPGLSLAIKKGEL